MALQFNFVTFAPTTASNGVTNVDSKVLVQGIGAKVKFVSSQAGSIYVSDQPLPSSFTTFPTNVIQLTELPTELYLAPGETIYAFNYTSNSNNEVAVIHYLDEAPAQNQPLNLSGSISLTGQL